MPIGQTSIYPLGCRLSLLLSCTNIGRRNGRSICSTLRPTRTATRSTPTIKSLITLQVLYRYFDSSVISDPIGNLFVLCLFQQVDNPAPTISRSGRPIELFPSGPISLISHNAPSLEVLMHKNVRFKKKTKRSKVSPSVAAATLAQAFKVKLLIIILYRIHPTLTSSF